MYTRYCTIYLTALPIKIATEYTVFLQAPIRIGKQLNMTLFIEMLRKVSNTEESNFQALKYLKGKLRLVEHPT